MTSPQARFSRATVSPQTVVSLLLQLAGELSSAASALDDLELEFVTAKEEHTAKYTKSFLKARLANGPDGKPNPQYVCETMANDECTDERQAMAIAEAKLKAHKRLIDTLETRISVGQTACKTLQAEIDLARMPTGR